MLQRDLLTAGTLARTRVQWLTFWTRKQLLIVVSFSSPPQIISFKNIITILFLLFWFSGKGNKSEQYLAAI